MPKVPDTILEQLGGDRFAIMTGARQFIGDADSLTFRIPTTDQSKLANLVMIRLMPSDTYNIELWRIRGTSVKKVKEVKDIQVTELQRAFTQQTGLVTSLGTMGGQLRSRRMRTSMGRR